MLRKTFHNERSGPNRRRQPRVKQALVLLACLTATAYFAYHAEYGRHGLLARAELQERSDLLDFELKSLTTVRAKLRHDVALLSPERPDPDMVEELARDVLGYVRPNDRIIGTQ